MPNGVDRGGGLGEIMCSGWRGRARRRRLYEEDHVATPPPSYLKVERAILPAGANGLVFLRSRGWRLLQGMAMHREAVAEDPTTGQRQRLQPQLGTALIPRQHVWQARWVIVDENVELEVMNIKAKPGETTEKTDRRQQPLSGRIRSVRLRRIGRLGRSERRNSKHS